MDTIIIAPFNLNIRDGTSARVTGEVIGVAKYVDNISIVAVELNNELKSIISRWIRPRAWRGLTSLLLCYLTFYIKSESLSNHLSRIFLPEPIEGDVIHVHWLSSVPLAYRASKGTPMLVDLHGLVHLQLPPRNSLKGFLLHEFMKILEKKVLNKYNNMRYLVPTEDLRIYLRKLGVPEDLIYVVPDGIDLRSIPVYREDEVFALRRNLGLEDKDVIAYVGNVSVYHGFEDLIHAYRLVRRKNNRAMLLLVVPRGFKSYIERLLGSSAMVLENVPRSEVYKYLYIADIVVLPHKTGTQFDYLYSNKLLDYIASGKPIVAYSLHPVKRLLRNYPLKILVEPNNVAKLAEGMMAALKWRERVDGKQYIKEFDWERIGERLYAVYRKLSQGN